MRATYWTARRATRERLFLRRTDRVERHPRYTSPSLPSPPSSYWGETPDAEDELRALSFFTLVIASSP